MARVRIKLSGPAAAAVVVALVGGWWLTKPEPFRRDLWLEARGVVRIASTYEASYRDCADPRWEVNADLRGFALGFIGRWAHRFPAESDADAVTFARAALPDCTLFALSRKKRFYFGARYNRRVPVDLRQY